MPFADLHIHSVHSHDGTCSIPAILKHVKDCTDLSVIAITDHDRTTGLKEALALAPRYGVGVVPGCEITTAQGHLLAFFITAPIPAGLSLVETVRRVGHMGGLCAIPHPEAPGIGGVSERALRAALSDPACARALVGIETYNSGLFFPASNARAAEMARTLPLAQIACSDSHILATIGDGVTEFDGSDPAALRAALLARCTVPLDRARINGREALRRWVPQFALRKMGWVAWNAAPHAPIQYARMDRVIEE